VNRVFTMIPPLGAALLFGLAACAPNAIFFHESTKVGFSAVYNTADSQPVSSHFGFKRRIVAVVPSQERVLSADKKESNATNAGEALSLVSKFYVSVGSKDGVAIRNNFASGEAARRLTRGTGGAPSVRALMHSPAVIVKGTVDKSDSATPAQAIDEEIARIKRSHTKSSSAPPARRETSAQTTPPLPKSPETPEPTPAVTATPPPATREVGSDGIIKPKPDQ
jgi:hypothetical protein